MDSSHSVFANVVPSVRLVLEADFDPQLPSRVLGRFAELGRLPKSFVARNFDDATLRLELEFACEPDAARLLSRRLLNVPSVRSVDLSFHRARMAHAAAA
jgi:hypothetical protein